MAATTLKYRRDPLLRPRVVSAVHRPSPGPARRLDHSSLDFPESPQLPGPYQPHHDLSPERVGAHASPSCGHPHPTSERNHCQNSFRAFYERSRQRLRWHDRRVAPSGPWAAWFESAEDKPPTHPSKHRLRRPFYRQKYFASTAFRFVSRFRSFCPSAQRRWRLHLVFISTSLSTHDHQPAAFARSHPIRSTPPDGPVIEQDGKPLFCAL